MILVLDILAGVLTTLVGHAASLGLAQPRESVQAKVLSMVDGDSVDVQDDGSGPTTVDIDTPESKQQAS